LPFPVVSERFPIRFPYAWSVIKDWQNWSSRTLEIKFLPMYSKLRMISDNVRNVIESIGAGLTGKPWCKNWNLYSGYRNPEPKNLDMFTWYSS